MVAKLALSEWRLSEPISRLELDLQFTNRETTRGVGSRRTAEERDFLTRGDTRRASKFALSTQLPRTGRSAASCASDMLAPWQRTKSTNYSQRFEGLRPRSGVSFWSLLPKSSRTKLSTRSRSSVASPMSRS